MFNFYILNSTNTNSLGHKFSLPPTPVTKVDKGLENLRGSVLVKKILRKWLTRVEWSMSTEPGGERSRFRTSQQRNRERARFEMKRSRFRDAFRLTFFMKAR
jgi:hypothetical protein